MNLIAEGSSVLYIWSGEFNQTVEQNVNELKSIKNIDLKVENFERLSLGESRAVP